MKKRILIIIGLALLGVAYAGPFGFEMGWSYEECVNAGFWVGDYNYYGGFAWDCHPPESSPEFDYYEICIDDKYGVYEIIAETESRVIFKPGYKFWKDYERLQGMLQKKYGEIYEFNWETQQNSEPTLPYGWVESFLNKEFFLYSTWSNLNDFKLSSISLEALPEGSDSYKIELKYYSSDWDAVLKKHQQERDEALYNAL
ncbi:MAG: hypothetical protein WC162_04550 [Sphaerochaetaceae bacterium]